MVHRTRESESGSPAPSHRASDNCDESKRKSKSKSKSKSKPRLSGLGSRTIRPVRNIRERRETTFRHPSSVREMQMRTEDSSEIDDVDVDVGSDVDEYLTPPRRRVYAQPYYYHSPDPSPLKRSSQSYYYSPPSSAAASTTHRQYIQQHQQSPPAQKEYPLVLLHCNILPPTLNLPAAIGVPNQEILEEVLPPQYWRRWKLLEEKTGYGSVQDRGVLIAHPQDMYDLLEERLLESLELQRPRLYGGHFLAPEEESEVENKGYDGNDMQRGEEESCTDEEQGETCPDCGRKVVGYSDDDNSGKRKWEIRVFAANGLMKEGAWAAAWKEMEKVDVEVGLWLPSEVRRELERRVSMQDGSTIRYDYDFGERSSSSPLISPKTIPENGIGNSPFIPSMTTPTQDQIDGLYDKPILKHQNPFRPATESQQQADINHQTLLKNYLRILTSDRRNIAIVVLSVLAVVLAVAALRLRVGMPSLFLLDSGPGLWSGSMLSVSQGSGFGKELVKTGDV